MNYKTCYDLFKKTDKEKLGEEIGHTIDEIFIASSDFNEMTNDLDLIRANDFNTTENLLTCSKGEYSLYVLADDGTFHEIKE